MNYFRTGNCSSLTSSAGSSLERQEYIFKGLSFFYRFAKTALIKHVFIQYLVKETTFLSSTLISYPKMSVPRLLNSTIFLTITSLEGLFPEDSVTSLDDTSLQLKYFHCSQSEGINSGDVAFLAGLLETRKPFVFPPLSLKLIVTLCFCGRRRRCHRCNAGARLDARLEKSENPELCVVKLTMLSVIVVQCICDYIISLA